MQEHFMPQVLTGEWRFEFEERAAIIWADTGDLWSAEREAFAIVRRRMRERGLA